MPVLRTASGGSQHKYTKSSQKMSSFVVFVDNILYLSYSGIILMKGMIPVKQIQNAILEICGDLTREEFSTLCCAIYEYRSFLPHHPQMKVICSNVKVSANKPSVSAVSKNLERAVIHLFEEGDLDILGSYQRSWLFERPLPNQFIRTVALQLWDGQVPSTQAG